MLDLEAFARGEHYALLLKKVHTKISGQHLLLIVYEGCGSGYRPDIVNFRSGVYPVIEDLSVGVEDLSVPLDDLILMLKSKSGKFVVDPCAADGIIVASLAAEVDHFRIAAYDPAQSQACQ